MQEKRATPEQERTLRNLFGELGPKVSMHIFQGWLNESVQTGSYGPQYKDTVTNVITSLRDAEQNLSDIRS